MTGASCETEGAVAPEQDARAARTVGYCGECGGGWLSIDELKERVGQRVYVIRVEAGKERRNKMSEGWYEVREHGLYDGVNTIWWESVNNGGFGYHAYAGTYKQGDEGCQITSTKRQTIFSERTKRIMNDRYIFRHAGPRRRGRVRRENAVT